MVRRIKQRFVDQIARNLRKPGSGLFGAIVSVALKRSNRPLQVKCVDHLELESHHNVLEIGFGLGYAIKQAASKMKDGPGVVFGVEISDQMMEKSSSLLRGEIQDRKVKLSLSSVTDLPFSDDTFERVYHMNCYYFWPDMHKALKEIHRVMKPESLMVTFLQLNGVKYVQSKGYLKYGNPDTVRYMTALEDCGFKNVQFEYLQAPRVGKYQAIFAHVREKNFNRAVGSGPHDAQETAPVSFKSPDDGI